MRRILITTEGSTCSTEAVRQFVSLFEPTRCELYMLAVIPPAARPDGHPGAAEHYHRQAEEAQRQVSAACLQSGQARQKTDQHGRQEAEIKIGAGTDAIRHPQVESGQDDEAKLCPVAAHAE